MNCFWTRVAVILALIAAALFECPAQGVVSPEKRGLDGITTKIWKQLTDQNVSRLGETALSVNPASWQHAETENFIYHFQSGPAGTQVAIEAEFYYKEIAADLQKDQTTWQRKAHIFIFEGAPEWAAFQKTGGLDPWTGGLHSGNELYVLRDGKMRWKGWTLGHEIAHLVVNRFFPGQIPLWLNEGYAENASRTAYAKYMRARGYRGTPPAPRVPMNMQMPLEKLMTAVNYPLMDAQVALFYEESDSLVRFLMETDKAKFLKFFGLLSTGWTNERALEASFFGDYSTMTKLQAAFQTDTARDGVLARKL